MRLTRVRDDGGGIPAAELALALSRHATSKIASADDLGAITTLGFRGEALPSIASVSRFEITSRHVDAERAAQRERRRRAVSARLSPAAHPPGTTIEVRDLFYNLPARRKFLRSEVTEQGHIVRLLERLALSRDDVAFRLRTGSRTLLDAPALAATAAPRHAARAHRRAANSSHARSSSIIPPGPVRISGWIGAPSAARASSDLQFWFVNGRAVRDRLLMNAVRLGYRDVLYSGRQPAYVLYLDIDPALVDVNAHPQKLEVRFRDSRQIHDFVFRAVERKLAGTQPRHQRGAAGIRHRQPVHATDVAACAPMEQRPRASGRWRDALRGMSADPHPHEAERPCRPMRAASSRWAGARAGAWHLHPGAERAGPGAGRHARRARAHVVREAEGAVGQQCADAVAAGARRRRD